MIAIFFHVAQQSRRGIDVVDDYINVAIIEQIAEGCASGGNYICQAAAGCGWDFLKSRAVKIAEQLRTLRPCGAPILPIDARVDMSVGDKDVEQTVVVEVYEARSPR